MIMQVPCLPGGRAIMCSGPSHLLKTAQRLHRERMTLQPHMQTTEPSAPKAAGGRIILRPSGPPGDNYHMLVEGEGYGARVVV